VRLDGGCRRAVDYGGRRPRGPWRRCSHFQGGGSRRPAVRGPSLEDEQVHPSTPVVHTPGNAEPGRRKGCRDAVGRGSVIRGQVEEGTGREIDDSQSAGWLQCVREGRGERRPVRDVVQNVAHEDGITAARRERRIQLPGRAHLDVAHAFLRRQILDGLTLLRRQLGCIDAATRPDAAGDLHRETSATRADLSDDAPGTDRECRREAIGLACPAIGQDVKSHRRADMPGNQDDCRQRDKSQNSCGSRPLHRHLSAIYVERSGGVPGRVGPHRRPCAFAVGLSADFQAATGQTGGAGRLTRRALEAQSTCRPMAGSGCWIRCRRVCHRRRCGVVGSAV
jgi:hypothetical protein